MESIDSYTHRRIMESWRAAKKEADYTGRKKMNWNEYMEQVMDAGKKRRCRIARLATSQK